MSIRLMNVVWGMKLNHTDKLVLLALADNASDEGVCWPSVTTISKKTSLSRRGVQASVARLHNDGILQRVFRNGHSNNYLIRIINGEIDANQMHPANDAPAHAVHPPCAPDAHPLRTPCTQNHHRTIIEPSIERDDDGFQYFWDQFPKQRKGSQEEARKAYRKALTKTTKEVIHEAVVRYSASREVAEGYAAGTARWLNAERWTDQPAQAIPRQAVNGKPTYADSIKVAAQTACRVLQERESLLEEDIF